MISLIINILAVYGVYSIISYLLKTETKTEAEFFNARLISDDTLKEKGISKIIITDLPVQQIYEDNYLINYLKDNHPKFFIEEDKDLSIVVIPHTYNLEGDCINNNNFNYKYLKIKPKRTENI